MKTQLSTLHYVSIFYVLSNGREFVGLYLRQGTQWVTNERSQFFDMKQDKGLRYDDKV